MKKAIVTVGVSASGKTTWAKDFAHVSSPEVWAIVSRDDFRREILEDTHKRVLKPGELWKLWKFKHEDKVTDRVWDFADHKSQMGHNLIFADTNLSTKTRTALIDRLRKMKYEVEVKEFPVTLEEAWKRDAGRPDGVGHDIIFKQMEQWNAYKGRKTYAPDTSRPSAVIFDVDGTLAHMDGGRGPFEWNQVNQDRLDEVVAWMVKGMSLAGHKIIIMSGRDGECYQMTADWLGANNVKYHALFMRAEGDMRKDAEIKEELFWAHVADHYNVVAVVDDRPVMCRRWMELGMKVINVGNPYKEF